MRTFAGPPIQSIGLSCPHRYNAPHDPGRLYDFVLIGADVLVVCVLIAYSPFTDRPRRPMLFGILSATFIMAVYLLVHLMW